MSDKLVTIATFLEPVEAELMRNRLAENGIRAVLENYQTTQAMWYLTQALGGIKLLVRELDAEAALAVLDELHTELATARAASEQAAAELDEQYIVHSEEPKARVPETADEAEDEETDGDRWWEVEDNESDDALDEEAQPWQPPIGTSHNEPPPPPRPSPAPVAHTLDDASVEDDLLLNGREELALKTFRVAVLGYYFLPLQLYVPYLVINALYDPRPLQPDIRKKLRWAIWLNAFFWLLLGMMILLPFGIDVLKEISTDWTRSLKRE